MDIFKKEQYQKLLWYWFLEHKIKTPFKDHLAPMGNS